MKLKKGDNIIIISGKDKNKKAKIFRVFPNENKIIAEGINIKKKHQRPKKQGEKGRRLEIPAPFNISKAMIICGSCSKPTRIGYKLIDKNKIRICGKCKAELS